MTFSDRQSSIVVAVIGSLAFIMWSLTLWNCFHRRTLAEHTIRRHATGPAQWFYRRPVLAERRRVSTGRPYLRVRVRRYITQFAHHLWMWAKMKAGTARRPGDRDSQEDLESAATADVALQDLEAEPPWVVVRDENVVLVATNASFTDFVAIERDNP